MRYFGKTFILLILFSAFACSNNISKKNKAFSLEKADLLANDGWNIAMPKLLRKIDVADNWKDQVTVKAQENYVRALNLAIEVVSEKGGGKVIVPAGRHLLEGSIIMKSNINLYLSFGAVLVFSGEPKHFLPTVKVRWDGLFCQNYSPMIYAYQEKNISITGKGIVLGQSEKEFDGWRQKQAEDVKKLQEMATSQVWANDREFGKGHFLRPSGIEFVECQDVLLEDFSITDMPKWAIHPVLCKNLVIRRLSVGKGGANNEGILLDGCQNTLVEQSYINTKYDCLAIKSGRGESGARFSASESIIIRNNDLESANGNGFGIGSEISGDVNTIFMENNQIHSENGTALNVSCQLGEIGSIRNVYIRNIRIFTAKNGLYFNTVNSNSVNEKIVLFNNFFVENISIEQVTGIPIRIISTKENPISNVYLHNFFADKSAQEMQVENIGGFAMNHVVFNKKL